MESTNNNLQDVPPFASSSLPSKLVRARDVEKGKKNPGYSPITIESKLSKENAKEITELKKRVEKLEADLLRLAVVTDKGLGVLGGAYNGRD